MSALRRAVASHLGGLPATFWWLWGGVLVNSLATFVFPFLALYLTSRGLGAQNAGLVVSIFGGGVTAGGPVAGILADRVGRKPTLLSALAGSAIAAICLALLHAPLLVGAAVLAFGVCCGMAHPTFAATIADVVPSEARPRAFGLLHWANNFGTGFSAVVGGAIASRSWLGLFLADAATTAICACLLWRRIPETRPLVDTRAADAPMSAGYSALLRDRHFLAFFAIQLCFLIVFFQFQLALPVAFARKGLSPAQYGRVLAVNCVLIVLVQPWAGRLVQRFDRAYALCLAALVVGLGYGAYRLCATEAQFAAATAVWSLGEIVGLPTALAVVADLAPTDLRGRYQGTYSLAFGIAMMASPALGGAVVSRFGADVLWSACLLAGVAVAAAHLAAGRARRRRACPAPCEPATSS